MDKIDICKDKLLKYLLHSRVIGSGCFGIVVAEDRDTVAKIYVNRVIDSYLHRDSSRLDEEIKKNKEISKYSDDEETRYLEEKKFEYLKRIGLLKGVLTYEDYKIGVLLKYYWDYEKLENRFGFLGLSERKEVLKNIKEKLDEMMNNGIYPLDIKENNILIKDDSFNIVFIDLDDELTRWESKAYVLNHPHIKDNCIIKNDEMIKRLEIKYPINA